MTRDQAMWTEPSVTVQEVTAWEVGLEALQARIAERFGRPEPRRRARAYLKGLLSPMERRDITESGVRGVEEGGIPG